MKGEWRIQTTYSGCEKLYEIYRIRDTSQTDHSGNREYTGPMFETREDAERWMENEGLK